ncbi:hypothetical protein AGMMS50256_30840 [Betaproteobacteria bacterium]|nr:hypothetical protein AGMMS50256_30840 [Betaproteobacteria bacterium]
MDEMQPIDMRRRIRELLSIPERDRTDAEWDELNELEIRTAPGNRDYDRSQDRQGDNRRQSAPLGQGRRPPDRNNNKPQQGNKNGNVFRQQQPDGRPEGGGRSMLKRQHRRPKRPGDAQVGVEGQNAAFSPIIVEIPSSGGDKSEE